LAVAQVAAVMLVLVNLAALAALVLFLTLDLGLAEQVLEHLVKVFLLLRQV
jgi:hypothetical protein